MGSRYLQLVIMLEESAQVDPQFLYSHLREGLFVLHYFSEFPFDQESDIELISLFFGRSSKYFFMNSH